MNLALKLVSKPTPDPVEAEFEKDVWNVRNIPGVRFTKNSADYLLPFTQIPDAFRSVVKRYLRYRVSQVGHGEASNALRYLRYFLMFYDHAHPKEDGLQNLSRADMEAYALRVRTIPNQQGKVGSPSFVWQSVRHVRQFLEYLQRTSSPEAPKTVVSRLIWPEDGGRKPQQIGASTVKYIPEGVLLQLDQHLDKLDAKKHRPIVLLLRASGWRMSDVLNLRWHTCLEQTTYNGRAGWWLVGDIIKTQVLGHKVPISEEIARVVSVLVAQVKADFTETENPDRYLFSSKDLKRRGQPIYAQTVGRAINRLAAEYNITDDMGTVFHFKSHAFRHTKAVELINNGMSLIHVQTWLAHKTPEMTTVYAKLLDPTMRQEWEKAMAKGAVRIDPTGTPVVVAPEHLGDDTQIEWEYIRHNLDAQRLKDGFCFLPSKTKCEWRDDHCRICPNFCTTPEFLPQLRKERLDTLQQIELDEKAGNVRWVERNRLNLEQLEPIIELLETGKNHQIGGKGFREYTPQERERRRQDGK